MNVNGTDGALRLRGRNRHIFTAGPLGTRTPPDVSVVPGATAAVGAQSVIGALILSGIVLPAGDGWYAQSVQLSAGNLTGTGRVTANTISANITAGGPKGGTPERTSAIRSNLAP